MTPQQHARQQAVEEAHVYFATHGNSDAAWLKMRAAWIDKRTAKLNSINEGKTK